MEVALTMLKLRPNTMKTTLFVLFIFCSAAAFGQLAPVLPNQPAPVVLAEHPQHASPHDMAPEQPLVGGMTNTYTYARRAAAVGIWSRARNSAVGRYRPRLPQRKTDGQESGVHL